MPEQNDDEKILEEADIVDDIRYFTLKLEAAKTEEEIKMYQRRIKLLLDSVVVYRLTQIGVSNV